MAFDGFTTAALTKELADRLTGARVQKVVQSESDELILTMKLPSENGGGNLRVLMSADPSLPLCYISEANKPAPQTAPAFCMLLRKHLQNGRVISVTQPGLERIIRIEIEHYNEMGDLCTHTLVIELMGKHSNIILLDHETVVDSIKRVSSMVSSVREVLPGRTYFGPDTQNKLDPLMECRENMECAMMEMSISAPQFLVKRYTGFSTRMAEELTLRARLSQDRSVSELSGQDREQFWNTFSDLMADVREGRFSPVIYYHLGAADAIAQGEPVDYSAVPLSMFRDLPSTPYGSMSALLETYYAQKNAVTRIRQKSADLRKIVQTILERDVHKYDLQRKQLEDTKKRDKYRVYGELLNAYGYGIPEGAKSAELDNYYTGEKLTVPLDPTLTAQQNAKKYFDRYTKLKRTEEALKGLTEEVREEIEQLRSIRTGLDLSQTEADLQQVRRELEECGFVKRHVDKGGRKNPSRTPAGKPLHYISSDGYDIYVGKNNLQNDELTFKMATGSDIWFHANDIPGSHVILRSQGKKMEDIPDRAFEEAARVAAYYSSARTEGGSASSAGSFGSSKVEIDYLERRNVKKPSGARPGFVVYYTNYSILVPADITGLELGSDQ
ncbi:MAG: NFACT family protein [Lachnospiraceae bacterium]|nr:NFACT family protein [Lachnospiraceae bacterium]